MQPIDIHTFLLWLLIIGAVCFASLAGAAVNRLLTRRMRASAIHEPVRRRQAK